MIFGVPAAVIASVILILSYAVLFSEKLNRAVAVMLGAAAMVLLGVLSYDQALKGIDFNTIALLIGMMIMVGIMEKIRRVPVCGGQVGEAGEGESARHSCCARCGNRGVVGVSGQRNDGAADCAGNDRNHP